MLMCFTDMETLERAAAAWLVGVPQLAVLNAHNFVDRSLRPGDPVENCFFRIRGVDRCFEPASLVHGVVERYALAETAGERLTRAGFVRIGVDHFARPSDTLAAAAREHRVQRNFQGYTVDSADALLGFGASAIGRLPQGYVQNETAIKRYERCVEAGDFATARGVVFSEEDRLRGGIIERLMCDMSFSSRALAGQRGDLVRAALSCAAQALAEDRDGFLQRTPDGFIVTELGRPFLRTIAARFDAYLPAQEARHSLAV
jgi:oxygen-independent coproporphyrinogen-3 oxidase